MRIKRKNNNIILLLIISLVMLFCIAEGTYYILKKDNQTSGKEDMVVIKNDAEIRTGPDDSYPVLKNISSGATVVKISRLENWYEIETDDKFVGWIPGWLIVDSGIKSPDEANKEKLSNYTVILNPISKNDETADYLNVYPKTYNLEIAKQLAKKLKDDNIKVILTREDDDKIVNTDEIKTLATDNNADLIINFDMINATKNNSFGVKMTYNSTSAGQVAKLIEKNLSNHYIGKTSSSEKKEDMEVISDKLPEIKIVSANLGDKVDVDILNDKLAREQYIVSLKDGIESYLYYLISIDNYNSKRKEQLLNLPQKGMTIPYYYTKQDSYKNISYGVDNNKTIETNGDAIISLAMISKYLTPNNSQSVEEIAKWAGNKYYIKGQGTQPTIVNDFVDKFNYNAENVKLDEFDKIKQAIKDNKPILVRLKSGLFGAKATYKVVRGYEDDKFYINDPDDDDVKLNSYNGFTENDLKTNVSQIWIISNK